MTLISIGDLAQSLMLRHNVTQAKTRMNTLSQEMSSGIKADLAAHLHGNMNSLEAMNAALRQVDAFATVTTELGLQVSAMQTALGTMGDMASRLAVPLQAAQSAGTTSFGVLTRDATETFKAAISLINTQIAGRSVFAGVAPDQTPLPDGAQFLTTLERLVAGDTTMTALRDRLDQWFADPAGFAAIYRGGGSAGSIAIAPGDDTAIAVTALDPAIRDSLKSFALAALAEDGRTALDATGRRALAIEAGARLLASEQARADLRAGLGLVENRIEAASTRNSAERTALGIARTAIIEADPYTTATDLSAAQTRLDTIYAITSRLSGLSLVNYLR